MLTKLKYAGVSIEDLIDIYVLFIRSIAEYCSVVFHSSLTNEQTFKIEQIQKICLKVILGEMYVSYSLTFEMTNLTTLAERREKKMFGFCTKMYKTSTK